MLFVGGDTSGYAGPIECVVTLAGSMLIDGPESACATMGRAGVAMYRLASSIGSIMSTRKGLWLFILWIHTCWLAELSCKCCDEVVDVNKTVVCNVGIVGRCGDQVA